MAELSFNYEQSKANGATFDVFQVTVGKEQVHNVETVLEWCRTNFGESDMQTTNWSYDLRKKVVNKMIAINGRLVKSPGPPSEQYDLIIVLQPKWSSWFKLTWQVKA